MRKHRYLPLLLALFLPLSAWAEGQTLRTVSCFAGADTAAEAYVDILNLYEAETGNTVLDHSAASDEAGRTVVRMDIPQDLD